MHGCRKFDCQLHRLVVNDRTELKLDDDDLAQENLRRGHDGPRVKRRLQQKQVPYLAGRTDGDCRVGFGRTRHHAADGLLSEAIRKTSTLCEHFAF